MNEAALLGEVQLHDAIRLKDLKHRDVRWKRQ